ncbi:hypothetical protein NRB20_18960 [Nocardia sp. RB20]|uniref:Uncharacterized protein n=1 Tax=Nocardia macrotermitis TaxID=2585198 RepID=A0A7K0CZB1_9NOCA|nr:hypothetical protein [Nocardia macrotermitis]
MCLGWVLRMVWMGLLRLAWGYGRQVPQHHGVSFAGGIGAGAGSGTVPFGRFTLRNVLGQPSEESRATRAQGSGPSPGTAIQHRTPRGRAARRRQRLDHARAGYGSNHPHAEPGR